MLHALDLSIMNWLLWISQILLSSEYFEYLKLTWHLDNGKNHWLGALMNAKQHTVSADKLVSMGHLSMHDAIWRYRSYRMNPIWFSENIILTACLSFGVWVADDPNRIKLPRSGQLVIVFVLSPQYLSRSSRLNNFPVGWRGSFSWKSMLRGHLMGESRDLQ